MASSILFKFDKYWKMVNRVMTVGVVLDSRYKLKLLDYFCGSEVEAEIEKVTYLFQKMITEYELKIKEKENVSSSSSQNLNVSDVVVIGKKSMKV